MESIINEAKAIELTNLHQEVLAALPTLLFINKKDAEYTFNFSVAIDEVALQAIVDAHDAAPIVMAKSVHAQKDNDHKNLIVTYGGFEYQFDKKGRSNIATEIQKHDIMSHVDATVISWRMKDNQHQNITLGDLRQVCCDGMMAITNINLGM